MIWKKSPPTSRAGRYSLSTTKPGERSSRLRQDNLLQFLGLFHVQRHQSLIMNGFQQATQQQQADDEQEQQIRDLIKANTPALRTTTESEHEGG